MGPSEIPLRARRELAARLDDAAYRRARMLWRRVWYPSDARLFITEPLLDRPLGFLNAERATLLTGARPDEAAAIVFRAEGVLAGRVRLLGYPEVTLGDPPAWWHDPFEERTWPDRHGKLLDYRHAPAGDPKWVWELNRCQDLPLLALAWRLSGDNRFAAGAADRLLAWLEHTPPARGIAWSNGLEAALRAISFALAYDCLRGSAPLEGRMARPILRALWQHARFTLGDLSPASSANNHLVGELAGLAVVGLLAPELRDAERFRERGLAGLDREAERQILPDGTGAEQAFAYHLFVLDLFLLVAALADSRSVELPSAIPAALARAQVALDMQVQDREPDPTYGDADDGCAFVLDANERRGARSVSATIAAGLGRPTAAPAAATLLLFGAHPGGRELRVTPRSVLLPDSRLVVLRRAGARALFDSGPLGYLSLAAHGHADALQVTLAEGDLELVGDPGTGSYYGDPARRAAFRGTSFHATVVVDGLDQAEQVGPFLWRRHYRAHLRTCDLDDGVVVGEHDGYARLSDPVRHTRALLAMEDGSLLVVDRLTAHAAHHYAQSWPLSPTLEARDRQGLMEATLGGVPRLLLCFAASSPSRVRLHRGVRDPHRGWWSRRLEAAEPAWTVVHDVECTGGVTLVALILLERGRALPDPELVLRANGPAIRVAFVHEGRRRRYDLDLDDPMQPVRDAAAPTRAEALR
jgi:hypothetical protein